ncbi:hypothetical protein GCM10023196_035630 [Actinoallomurus vinaceus]|uniref:Peptidoglycan binding-like domain-containing protein n=1 Tax=Actinoallomurus vinaceus TaxID=1080074 RepID=A0ABP8U915_9ACTN
MATDHSQHGEDFDPLCPQCCQEAATAGFRGEAGTGAVRCPSCGHTFEPVGAAVRVTEATDSIAGRRDLEASDPKKPYGDVEYADPGWQKDGKKRYPLDSEAHVKAAWSYVNQADNQKPYSADQLSKIQAKIRTAAKKLGIQIADQASEAMIDGEMSFSDIVGEVTDAIRKRVVAATGQPYADVWVADITTTDVVYEHGGDLFQCPYAIDQAGTVTLGEPVEVVRTYAPAPAEGDDGDDDDDVMQGEFTAPDDDGDGEDAAAGEAWNAQAHPRAPAGSTNGGQFAPLSYDSKSNTGTGYGSAKGDAHVRQLQEALNRLGLTDGNGKKLAVDGKLGPLTTAAVKKAQKALGLKQDGKVTPDLLKRLRSSKSLTKASTAKATRAGSGQKKVKAMTATSAKAGEAEERAQLVGRILEAKGEDADGGRVFRTRIIAYGDSKNRRRYPEAVMREAAHLYEGARAYDHHRTDEELRTSTIAGLVGSYRNVEATEGGIEADLHLLPSATHAAEALDATVAAQEAGLPPLIGLSHDVMARFKPVTEGGLRIQEATAITQVNSADLVADPAAGGLATRMVAGGIEDTDGTGTEPAENEEDDVPPTKEDILGVLAEATDEELAKAGLTRKVEAGGEQGEPEAERETEAAGVDKASFMGGLMVKAKVEDAGLPAAVVEGVRDALPDRFTEADVDNQIAALKGTMGLMERAQLMPSVASTKVTQESHDKKVKALDAFFAGKFSEGYRSFKQAWADITGHRPLAWDADVNRVMLRESVGLYDSGDRMRVEEGVARVREGMDSTSWNLVLGDSITRRMIAEYSRPDLSIWRNVVSSIVPLNDFRTQRIERVGGYGTLPTVNQGAPYQDLTSPGNEEVTYAPSKKGGIESITFEMIANDDVRAISKIPTALGRAAAQTLYRFVFDTFTTNAATTYDGVTLFHANHGNTGTSALSGSALSAVRAAMRQQTAYGDNKDILSITPQTLIVPSALEELAWQLATSLVAMPAGAPTGAASDIPNIHSRMSPPIVVDYYSDQNDWYAIADPSAVPTIEVGFYNGRQDPELFTQADPTVGSMFDADKVTYKARHIYGLAVLDHRGVYRNTL